MRGLISKIDNWYYYWKRNNWMFYLPRFFSDFNSVKIDRPIFLLGNQGDGITLISRFLRRHTNVVSSTGNHQYWTGADEMQRVMEYRLPTKLRLSGRLLSTDPPHPQFFQPRSWSYGSDDLYEAYHNTERDFSKTDKKIFEKVIREVIYRFGKTTNVRFVDKSQVYSLKMRYVHELLKEHHPHFVLFTRNPYVTCYRAAVGGAGDMNRYTFLTHDEKVRICAEHWSNVMRTLLEDSKQVEHFKVFRFEDFLLEPRKNTIELCDFVGLDFQEDMLPAPHQKIPFGTKYSKRWYPLQPAVNDRYLAKMSDKDLQVIHEKCGDLAEYFGYEKPKIG